MCSSIYSFYPVPLITQCQSFRLTFVLCSLKILPTRFHMGIFDCPPDSSNIGPRLSHSSYNVKMGKDTWPTNGSSSSSSTVTSSSSHTSTFTQLMLLFSQHWSSVTSDTLQVVVASNDILLTKHQPSYAGPTTYCNPYTNSSTIYPIRPTIIVPTRPDPTTVRY